MFDRDNWQEIFNTLGQNKLRTVLTAFGVFWGIFMLVLLLAAGQGLSTGAYSAFGNSVSNAFWIWTQRTSIPYKGLPRGRGFRMDNNDTEALRAGIPEIDILAPRCQLGGWRSGNNVSRGTKTGGFEVYGDVPGQFDIRKLSMLKGRFINDFDLEERRKVAVIGERPLEILFEPGEDPIGKSILIQGVYFKVVGVHTGSQEGENGERDQQTIFTPITTFQQAFNYGIRINWYAISTKPGFSSSVAEKKAIAILGARHTIHPDDKRAFGHSNSEEEFEDIRVVLAGINWMVWFVGVFTLMAGIIGVSNIMLVTVKERTREIGIRRALGASPRAIVLQVLSEAVLLTSIAGYMGLLAAVFLIESFGQYIQHQFFRNPSVNVQVAVTALFILVLAGMMAGWLPANRALRVRPVVALKTE
ncbi:MAG: ABC transporter permease [Salibacteraceae bacterium]